MTAPSLEALLNEHGVQAHALLGRDDDAQRAARQLRTRVAAGQRVMLAQRRQRSPWTRVSSLWSKPQSNEDLVERLAGALLAAGLEQPSLVLEAPSLVAVCAFLPKRADPLDQVFDAD